MYVRAFISIGDSLRHLPGISAVKSRRVICTADIDSVTISDGAEEVRRGFDRKRRRVLRVEMSRNVTVRTWEVLSEVERCGGERSCGERERENASLQRVGRTKEYETRLGKRSQDQVRGRRHQRRKGAWKQDTLQNGIENGRSYPMEFGEGGEKWNRGREKLKEERGARSLHGTKLYREISPCKCGRC